MDRYQFEDLISAYIENTLTVPQKKEFEQRLKTDPQLAQTVEAVRQVMSALKTSPQVKTSSDFMLRLQRRIARERFKPTQSVPTNRRPGDFRILGFKPAYAGLMVALVVAVVFIGKDLLPTSGGVETVPPQMTAKVAPPPSKKANLPTVQTGSDLLANEEEDSSNTTLPTPSNQFEDKIQLVGNQP